MSDVNYDLMNVSELAELCLLRGFLGAHRGLGRGALVELLEGKASPDDFEPDPADADRNAMMQMKAVWPSVKEQLDCAEEHFPCWSCPAARAHICAVTECDSDILEKVKEEGR